MGERVSKWVLGKRVTDGGGGAHRPHNKQVIFYLRAEQTILRNAYLRIAC